MGSMRTLVLTACLAGIVLLPQAEPSTARATAARMTQAKPTIVLVHGAWADGSGWNGVIRRLQADGYTVIAPPDPLRGAIIDGQYVAGLLRTIPGPIVLVGHSYGGAVITNAATGNPSVRALVYVDALVPDLGESVLQLATARPGSCLGGDPTKVFDIVPGAPEGDADLYIKRDLFPGCFASELSVADAAVLASEERPIALSALALPSGYPAGKRSPPGTCSAPPTGVVPPAEQRFMAERAHARITGVAAMHPAMISHPDVVTDVILDAAREAG
jgi:pimeloyl-ACP methyl ester carboxylesterase